MFHLNQTNADGVNQDNLLSVATAANSGAALADATASQAISALDLPGSVSGSVLTFDAANAAAGVLGLNQSAAAGSSQANLVALALTDDPASLAHASATEVMSVRNRNGRAYNALANARIDNFGNGATGIIQTNQLAGTGGQQANIVALASAGQGIANADASAFASVANGPDGTAMTNYPAQAGAVVLSGSFAGATGIVQVNQAAGGDNIQSNLIAAAFGGFADASAISESSLADVRIPAAAMSEDDAAPDPGRVALSDPFDGFIGVGQVSLVSGYGNQTSNTISVSVSHTPLGR